MGGRWLFEVLGQTNTHGVRIIHDSGLHYTKRDEQAVMAEPPNIMLPSREQVYSDPYFREIFTKSVRLLRESKILVIVGYSLPKEDALLRFIIRQFAEEAEDGLGKHVFYVDPCDSIEQRRRIEAVFPSVRENNSPHVHTFEGTFDSFAEQCTPLIEPV